MTDWHKVFSESVIGVEQDPEWVIVDTDGRTSNEHDVHMIPVPNGLFDRMKAGWVCAVCYEPQDEAYPVKCRGDWCGFPIRAEQTRFLEERMKEAELARPTEVEDTPRKRLERMGVVIPRGVDTAAA